MSQNKQIADYLNKGKKLGLDNPKLDEKMAELIENEDAYINEFWMIDTKNGEDITEVYEYSK